MEIVKKELRARDYAADLLDGRVALSGVPEHLRNMALSMLGLPIHNLARAFLMAQHANSGAGHLMAFLPTSGS